MITPGYQALHEGCALVDLSRRGKIRLSGEDRARLLHAMSTNHVNGLAVGASLYAFFLSAQGRVLADVYISNEGESFLLDTEPETRQTLLDHLDKFIIADDVTLSDETGNLATLALEGPLAEAVAAQAGVATSNLGGLRIICPILEKDEIIARLHAAGVVDATAADYRLVQIEQRKPRYGVDFDATKIPQETQQMHAIHFSKGCYLGQEIVERVRSRGLVNRLLVPLLISGEIVPQHDCLITSGDKPVGKITSAAYSPTLGTIVGFGYVLAEILHTKAPLTVGESSAQAVEYLPGNV